MDLNTKEIQETLCSPNVSTDFLYDFNAACQSKNPQFETWLEILFLQVIREKDSEKILNIANHISLLPDGGDVRQVFYNIVLSNFHKGADDEFIHLLLSKSEARPFVVQYMCKLPIADVGKLITKLVNKYVTPDYVFYIDVLSQSAFYSTDKFTTVFDPCDVDLKQRICLGSLITNNYSISSKINSYFQSNPISFHHFSYDINNDYNVIIRALIEYIPTSMLMYGLSEFKNLIFSRHASLPNSIDELLVKAIKENNSTFIVEAASVVSKRKILGLLYEYNGSKIMKDFLEKFGEDPELEYFVPFA